MKLFRYVLLICSLFIYSHVFSEETPEVPTDEAPVVEEPAEPVMEEAEEKPAE